MANAQNARWGAPYDIGNGVTTATFTNITMDADGEYIGWGFIMDGEAGSTDTITHIGYRQGTTTGTPTNAYDIGIMDPGTDGAPDGTFNVSTQFTPVVGDDGKFIWVAITGTALTAGTPYYALLKANSSASGAAFITAATAQPIPNRAGLGFCISSVGGSVTRNTANVPSMAIKSATRVYGLPASSVVATNSYGSTTVENGCIVTIPTDWCSTFKVAGARWLDLTPAANRTHAMSLYTDPLGTPSLQQQLGATDGDFIAAAAGAFRSMEAYFPGSLVTLNAGSPIVVAFGRSNASDGNLYTIGVETAADFDGWAYGQQCAFVTRNPANYPAVTGSPAFTATATKRPWFELILADITPPAGGGGGGMVRVIA